MASGSNVAVAVVVGYDEADGDNDGRKDGAALSLVDGDDDDDGRNDGVAVILLLLPPRYDDDDASTVDDDPFILFGLVGHADGVEELVIVLLGDTVGTFIVYLKYFVVVINSNNPVPCVFCVCIKREGVVVFLFFFF